ncbi:MAG: hydroxymethylglutaryl-CoA synthase family protein [Catenulispora sp.]|nr:hydroxymethylglutaryl-CoA synthase family protein [Catenulispora sp.]
MTGRCGIQALHVYAGLARVPALEVFAGRGLDPERFGNLMMRDRSVCLPFEDTVTNAVNAARPLVDRIGQAARDRVELLVVCTESGLDYSKSVSSYVHEHLGLGRHCRLLEAKQACYSTTAALQLALGYVASGVSPGALALVVAADIPLADAEAGYAEPATGTGAVALLVGDRPEVLAVDPGAFGTYSFETFDTARPGPQLEVADVDRSLAAYLDCLKHSVLHYLDRVADADFATTFDYLAMHTPFVGMARAGHRRLMRELAGRSAEGIELDFTARLAPSLVYPGSVGNIFSGTLYLALASLIDHADLSSARRVGLFSYGSGCSSEFFSGIVDAGSRAALAPARIAEHLAERAELDFAEYAALIEENAACLVPRQHHKVDPGRRDELLDRVGRRGPLLVLTGIADYHRQYDWI